MQNDKGDSVELYNPRKCSWTKRLITAYDYAAVQINVGKVDPDTGRYIQGKFDTYALCGYIRDKGESNMALDALVAETKRAEEARAKGKAE